MRDEMDMVKSLQGPPSPAAPRTGKRERSFELSLPALVKGLDAAGRKFEERTSVCGISAQEVSLRLKARLTIDARLTLFLDIPRTLILESPLRLVLSGAVVYVRFEEKNDRQQFVVVRLDRGFRLHPNSLPPA
ncbi:MAG: hypothetical protein KA243_09540 [Candidatus Aminicenantes bacterium]|jgi:hypothetical protein|nr:hypothetical protein [Candidatus Aminicenantes bacterium]NLH78097.1 hypothetical protein [Acidobacteriota bacterium]